MKYGRKPLQLINGNSKPIHNRYCYKHGDKAVFRAMKLPHNFIQIWDEAKGVEVARILKSRKTIMVTFK